MQFQDIRDVVSLYEGNGRIAGYLQNGQVLAFCVNPPHFPFHQHPFLLSFD
jgi:hypothetical protein